MITSQAQKDYCIISLKKLLDFIVCLPICYLLIVARISQSLPMSSNNRVRFLPSWKCPTSEKPKWAIEKKAKKCWSKCSSILIAQHVSLLFRVSHRLWMANEGLAERLLQLNWVNSLRYLSLSSKTCHWEHSQPSIGIHYSAIGQCQSTREQLCSTVQLLITMHQCLIDCFISGAYSWTYLYQQKDSKKN